MRRWRFLGAQTEGDLQVIAEMERSFQGISAFVGASHMNGSNMKILQR